MNVEAISGVLITERQQAAGGRQPAAVALCAVCPLKKQASED